MDDKKFVVPEAEVINYAKEDIIVTSLTNAGEAGWDDGEGWN